MKFNINRERLLPVLNMMNTIVDRRHSLPILSNLLFRFEPGSLVITASDMEVEHIVRIDSDLDKFFDLTIPARKFFDICRALPQEVNIDFEVTEGKLLIRANKSRFTLATLPSEEYPIIDTSNNIISFKINQESLNQLLSYTQFAIAQQDVRYYLNGLLLEVKRNNLIAVATDGHRLALNETDIEVEVDESIQVIVPKKGVTELTKLLQNEDDITIQISENHIKVESGDSCLTSKLINGRFPDYKRVIPELSQTPVLVNRDEFKNSLARASILSNEKYRGVRVILSQNSLVALAHNPEQEEAEEHLEVDYQGEEIEIGFNVNYLLDTLAIIKSEKVKLNILSNNSSCLILPEDESKCQYVVMPMRL